jgi:hypothetical protein
MTQFRHILPFIFQCILSEVSEFFITFEWFWSGLEPFLHSFFPNLAARGGAIG